MFKFCLRVVELLGAVVELYVRAFHHISCNYAGKIVKLLFTTYFTKFPSRVAELLEVSSSICI